MTLKQLHEKSPKAFLEWITTLCPMHSDATIIAINETNVEVRSEAMNLTREVVIGDTELMCTPYYFDRFGIWVTIQRLARDKRWYFKIIIGETVIRQYLSLEDETRLGVTKKALPFAFELREKQLNKQS